MKIVFSIMYAGLQLPVLKNEQGQDVTPLKPISDLFGLRWKQQQEKVTKSEYLAEYLGVCTLTSWGADSQKNQDSEACTPLMGGADGQKREQTCILVARVAAFLMSINPEMVRAKGNVSGAKYLIAKQAEWADALHAYEDVGVAFKSRKKDAHSSIHEWFKTRKLAETPRERAGITRMIEAAFVEVGQPLTEEPQAELPL